MMVWFLGEISGTGMLKSKRTFQQQPNSGKNLYGTLTILDGEPHRLTMYLEKKWAW